MSSAPASSTADVEQLRELRRRANGAPLHYLVHGAFGLGAETWSYHAPEDAPGPDGFIGKPDPKGGAFPLWLPTYADVVAAVVKEHAPAVVWFSPDLRCDVTYANGVGWSAAFRFRLGSRRRDVVDLGRNDAPWCDDEVLAKLEAFWSYMVPQMQRLERGRAAVH